MEEKNLKLWKTWLKKMNPYTEVDRTGKTVTRPDLAAKIERYKKLKHGHEDFPEFSWIFNQDQKFLDPFPISLDNESINYGVPAGIFEQDPQKAQIYFCNLNPALAAGQEAILRSAQTRVAFSAFAEAEDATWIDHEPSENIIYQQLFGNTRPGESLSEILQTNMKSDKQHWYAQHVSYILRKLFDANLRKKTEMDVPQAQKLLLKYPAQFVELSPYRTSHSSDFDKFLKTTTTSKYQKMSTAAYEKATSCSMNFKNLPSGAKIAQLPTSQFVLANLVERIRVFLEEDQSGDLIRHVSEPIFVFRSYEKWWRPALLVFLTSNWEKLPKSLRSVERNSVSLLKSFEQKYFWTYISKRNVSVSATNVVRVSWANEFDQIFVLPFKASHKN